MAAFDNIADLIFHIKSHTLFNSLRKSFESAQELPISHIFLIRCQSVCKKAKQRPALLDYFSVFVLRSINHFCYQVDTSSFLKLISATIIVFQIKQVALTWDLNRLDAAVLNLTRENGDSTTFDVLRCFQCSRGKS